MAKETNTSGSDAGFSDPNGAIPTSKRSSPRGILTDISSNLNAEDIKIARHEIWSRFMHDNS